MLYALYKYLKDIKKFDYFDLLGEWMQQIVGLLDEKGSGDGEAGEQKGRSVEVLLAVVLNQVAKELGGKPLTEHKPSLSRKGPSWTTTRSRQPPTNLTTKRPTKGRCGKRSWWRSAPMCLSFLPTTWDPTCLGFSPVCRKKHRTRAPHHSVDRRCKNKVVPQRPFCRVPCQLPHDRPLGGFH